MNRPGGLEKRASPASRASVIHSISSPVSGRRLRSEIRTLFWFRVRFQQPRVGGHIPFVTCGFPHLVVRSALLGDTHRPGTREYCRIIYRRFVAHGVGVDGREALDDMRFVTVKITLVGDTGSP